MNDLRCAAVALPAGGDRPALLTSLDAARERGLGDLVEVSVLPGTADLAGRDALAGAAQAAAEQGFDWLLAVSDAETVPPEMFSVIAPALRIHDAVWGGAGRVAGDGAATHLEPITRLAAQDIPTFFHAALRWWIGPSHFVRPSAALDALRPAVTAGWYGQYMLALWRTCSAYKTAQPLTRFRGELRPLAEADRRHLLDALEAEPVFMPVHYGESMLLLPYTGVNPVIEREQTRGQFFEVDELRFLAARLPRGMQIVDAGANTGNHTVFFATAMAAETVTPIEPHPRAAAAIRDVVEANGLRNVDLSCLGFALGARPGRLRPALSATAGLGATRYVADPAGDTPLVTLDSLIAEPVDFLKIDVEGMELDVLAGAMGAVTRFRPAIFIEVLDAATPEFLAWIDANSYRIEKLFPDKAHCNYLLVPAEQS